MMWQTEHSKETVAAPAAIWQLFTQVDQWRSWNPGIAHAELNGPFRDGASGRVKRPGGHEGTFAIVEVDEGRSFVYEEKAPGGRLRILHSIERLSSDRSRVAMRATTDGPLSRVLGLITHKIIEGYVPTAVQQLAAKAEVESPIHQDP